MPQETLALYALNTIPGVGAVTLRALLSYFGSAQAAWEAAPERWGSIPDIGPKTILAFQTTRAVFDEDAALQTLTRNEISLIDYRDTRFPALLHEIPSPPALLYVRGDMHVWETRSLIAIVGSRKPTQYGEQVATELARELAGLGFVVVSGLAFGIDGIAHQATLDAQGKTLAILGSGNDDATLSPQSHRDLARSILRAGGALVSELRPGTPGTTGTFPARNRIMAGMSLGTIVVEATEGSGSLITADLALDYNREVFAVPGSIFSPLSRGTNSLIKRGAKVVTGIQDILEELAPHAPAYQRASLTPTELPDLSETESAIYGLLSHEPLHVDKIIAQSRLDTTNVNIALTQLEMYQLIKNTGNMHYIRNVSHRTSLLRQ